MKQHLTNRQIFAYVHHSLPWPQQTAYETHLTACQNCRAKLSQAERLNRQLQGSLLTRGKQITPSPNLTFAALRPHLKQPRRKYIMLNISRQIAYGLGSILLFVTLAFGTYSLVNQSIFSSTEDTANNVDSGIPINIDTVDNLTLKGSLYPSQTQTPAPAVLLVHSPGQDRYEWGAFISNLAASGYTVLTVDLRGHGETGGSASPQRVTDDLRQTWFNLARRPEVDAEHTFIIGTGRGADMAFTAGLNLPEVQGIVLLSPNHTVAPHNKQLIQLAERPVLIIAAEDDAPRASAGQNLIKLIPSAELQLFDGEAHGTAILKQSTTSQTEIIRWLNIQSGNLNL